MRSRCHVRGVACFGLPAVCSMTFVIPLSMRKSNLCVLTCPQRHAKPSKLARLLGSNQKIGGNWLLPTQERGFVKRAESCFELSPAERTTSEIRLVLDLLWITHWLMQHPKTSSLTCSVIYN